VAALTMIWPAFAAGSIDDCPTPALRVSLAPEQQQQRVAADVAGAGQPFRELRERRDVDEHQGAVEGPPEA
jgi:hypothetical protein